MQASYNHWLVALSYVIALIASYVALDMASRVAASRGTRAARYWLLGGSLAMGAGIWSMHFVGMLAFSLPIATPYTLGYTFLSLAFAVAASAVALHAISSGRMHTRRLVVAGAIMGCGVALMHYTGMLALEVSPRPRYEPALFTLSIIIAIAASIAALGICFRLRTATTRAAFWQKSASAGIMGIAIWGMHFTGMAAANFAGNSICTTNGQTIDNRWLALTVGLGTVVFLTATMLISFFDARLTERRSSLEAQADLFFNQSPNFLCIYALDGRFQRINPAAWRTLGFLRESLLAKQFMDLVHRDDRPAMLAVMQDLRSRRPTAAVECRCPCADGTEKVLLWNMARSDDGSGFYATGYDITGRKQAEAELSRTHRRLMEVSHAAGRAEVATNVLHNVGNVLNSVNISAALVVDQLAATKATHLSQLATMLEEHRADLPAFLTSDPRGQRVPVFIGTLAEQLGHERKVMAGELESLRKNVEHIKEIVSMQQNYARAAGVHETLPLTILLEEALRMNADSLVRHEIDLVREYRTEQIITTDKHKLMQILTNLLRNAKLACDESGRRDKRIAVRLESDAHKIQIAVSDNGVGITPENLKRIFQHGFTTRRNGHGFGLHSAALAAKELGGELRVFSAGAGLGAAFTLDLPAA